MNTTYENFKKDNRLKLFGHEDAGKEDNSRLTSYYYKTLQYEDVMSDIKLQIVTGEKGTGKSALLKMAFIETSNTDIVPIWIRLDDLSELYSEILNSENLYQLKTLWKRSISKLVIMNLASHMSFVMGEDYEKALQWAYDTGYTTRDFISRSAKILKPMYDKYISLDNESDSCGEHRSLQRMITNKKVRLFFDDFDLDWQGKASDVLKIKSLLLSLSDITSDMDGLLRERLSRFLLFGGVLFDRLLRSGRILRLVGPDTRRGGKHAEHQAGQNARQQTLMLTVHPVPPPLRRQSRKPHSNLRLHPPSRAVYRAPYR